MNDLAEEDRPAIAAVPLPKKLSLKRKKAALLEVLRRRGCNLAEACKAVGVARNTVWSWRKDDPEFSAAYDDAHEERTDWVESHLFRQIRDGSVQATTFYLKTKGKDRGYVERTEITGANGDPIRVEAERRERIELAERLLGDPELRRLATLAVGRLSRPETNRDPIPGGTRVVQ